MHSCPHCNQPGISSLRKLVLGTAVPAKCRVCQKKVVAQNKWVLIFAGIIGVLISIDLIIALMVFPILCYFYIKIIPLERAE